MATGFEGVDTWVNSSDIDGGSGYREGAEKVSNLNVGFN